MTATPYFDSYELIRKIKVDSIWVHKVNKRQIQIIGISGMYVGFRILENGIPGWRNIINIYMNYTPLEIYMNYTPLETEQ